MYEQIKSELQGLSIDDILDLAKERGYKVSQINNPDAVTFGHYRVVGSKMDGPDLWMNAANVVLYNKQLS